VGLARARKRERLAFSVQRVKLVEERWEMDDDAGSDDARDRRVDQPYK
jgi:hypothetical protein